MTRYRAILHAINQFLVHDGWAIASHIALSVLMSFFPFLIFITAFAGLLGSRALADESALLFLETWPKEVAQPLAREIKAVLTSAPGDILTVGAVLSVYFASSGVESLRIGLNRAYGRVEMRHFLIMRLESIGFVLMGALTILAVAFLVILGPTIVRVVRMIDPDLLLLFPNLTWLRILLATGMLVAALVVTHLWLPAGSRSLRDVWVGIVATLAMWLAGGVAFSFYLDNFSENYVRTYAGLASGMIALVFLYTAATIFLFGAEINAALMERRAAKEAARAELRAEAAGGPTLD